MNNTTKPFAALFDFDGVVVDTEPQYTSFWQEQGRKYHPEIPNFSLQIKGSTLSQIFENYFSGMDAEQAQIRRELTCFEGNMSYEYVPGIVDFLKDLRSHDVRLAIVTSSDRLKMEQVYKSRLELKSYFDRILLAEDFMRSKPFPDCYLLGAEIFNTTPDCCFVFEDSFNGLKSGNAACMNVIGLATTNPREAIGDQCSLVIDDFTGFTYEKMMKVLD